MNRNFGKLDENSSIIYAPDCVVVVDHHHEEWVDPETGEKHEEDWDTERRELHPTADDYAHAKDGPWLPVVSEPPQKTGVYFVPAEFGDLVDGVIRRRYDERPVVAPPTVYSVEEIIYGLIMHDALQAVKELVGDYWELLTMRDTVEAENDIFKAKFPELKAAIVASGALTEDEIAEILKEAEVR